MITFRMSNWIDVITKRYQNKISFIHFDKYILLFVLIIIIASVIREVGLTRDSMHLDEIWGVDFVTQRNFVEVIYDKFRDVTDPHPVIYYLLLDIWCSVFGCTAYASRMLSVIIGIISVFLIYKLAFLLFRCRATALLTAALATISPLHVRYSQETRMYIFLIATWTTCLYFLVLTIRNNFAFRWSILLALSFFLFGYSHSSSGFIVLPFLMLTLFFFDSDKVEFKLTVPYLKRRLLVIGLCVAIYIPRVVHLLSLARSEESVGRLTFTNLAELTYLLVFNDQLPLLSASFSVAIAAALFILFCYPLIILAKRLSEQNNYICLVLLSGSIIIPIVTVMILSTIKAFYQWRILSFLIVPILLLFSAAIVEAYKTFIKNKNIFYRYLLMVYFFVFVGCLLLPMSAVTYDRVMHGYQKENWREAVEYITQNSQAGDYLVFYADFGKDCFDYYFVGCEATSVANFEKQAYYNYITINRKVDLFQEAVNDLDKITRELDEATKIWVIYTHVWSTEQNDEQKGVLKWEADDLEAILLQHNLVISSVWQGSGILIKSYQTEAKKESKVKREI